MTECTQNSSTLHTPSVLGRWRFGDLSAADLLPRLQRYLITQDTAAHWQIVWLNNDGREVIGLLPKVSWSVYPLLKVTSYAPLYHVIKNYRKSRQSTQKNMSYSDWQQELIAYSDKHCTKKSSDKKGLTQDISAFTHPQKNKQPNYQHGLIGFIGYDIASVELSPNADVDANLNESIKDLKNQVPDIKCAPQPAAVLGHYDIYLNTHVNESGHAIWTLQYIDTESIDVEDVDKDSNHQQSLVKTLVEYLDQLDNLLKHKNKAEVDKKNQNSLYSLTLKAAWQKNDYQRAFAATQSYLLQGDCYQINLTQAWTGQLNQSADLQNTDSSCANIIDYLPALQRNTHAPFAGYLGLQAVRLQKGHSKFNSHIDLNFELLSCSPELFFTFLKDDHTDHTGTHYIRTKPIKGTMPRGGTVEQDVLLKQQLIDSAKDRSENVMIVDLLRNDLGKYAKTGSVKVPQLFDIESFSNVHHMVSTITAELKPDAHPLAVLFGSLPAGSITGAPKKRAVEIIAELESTARGAYCGTMGYMNFDGSGQWNVLIRTLQAQRDAQGSKQVSLWAGGGITIASDCAAEYQECLDKVGNLLNVLQHPNN